MEGAFRYSYKANRFMSRKDGNPNYPDGKPNYGSKDNGGSLSIEIGFDDPSEIDKIIEDLKQIETKLNPAVFENFLKNAEKYFIDVRAELNDDAAKPPAPQSEADPFAPESAAKVFPGNVPAFLEANNFKKGTWVKEGRPSQDYWKRKDGEINVTVTKDQKYGWGISFYRKDGNPEKWYYRVGKCGPEYDDLHKAINAIEPPPRR